jgi:hypothetical protein
MVLSGTLKFHMGWIRPFNEQIAKHIRNVKQGRWQEQGERLLAGGDRKLEQWAIHQVMGYEATPSIAYCGPIPDEMESLADMKHNNGIDGVLQEFEERYGISPFRG